MNIPTASHLRRWLLSLIALGGLCTAAAAVAGEQADKEAIEALIYCYAAGTDAIGDHLTNADPLAAGTAIYRRCFAPDAQIRAWFPHQPFDSQVFPHPEAHADTAPKAVIGPDEWAKFADSVFRSKGYTVTQHMISNVTTTVHGRTGTLTAYLNATHVISGDVIGGPSRCVAVANGTYSLNVQKINGAWKITSLDLTLITFNPVFQSGKGC
jgi:hypothetical protein